MERYILERMINMVRADIYLEKLIEDVEYARRIIVVQSLGNMD